ncbi:uncharacterized protein K444DRAFT_583031 [Hyaloscypha bicolor E]|uniref:DUF676 domain-containing protein n=1 Tax=Hyaloscypha bicolor E TaxID=1095630 RepID=A0A2J6TNI8_9HELO|nr:uncharacterized protein K444DRAFT_583031 [Hyaloscypha bicolor E]PMD64586.1 hypothetical protein K444DRAFT_583031 [Hyaloscypha bicolor E]
MEAGQTSDIAETPPANPAPSEFRRVDVSETSFTTLYDGSEKDGKDAIVDIIFVHGLGGNPETTWSTSKPSHETFWPAEFLLAAFPCTRILTWGYDSKVTLFFSGSVDQGSYYSHTKDLLYDVNDIRATNSRPIVWIAHSLGGIIVKEALLRAQSGLGDNSLKDIYDSTKQVLFLGTPHRGSSMASWGILAERIVKAAGFDTNAVILKQLTTQSPALGNLNERFISLLRSQDFDVVTFQEAKGMEGMRGLNGKVVEDFSSTIADERQRTIPGNHSEMCKFSSIQETGYRRIEAELRRVILKIQEIAGNGALAQAGSSSTFRSH